MAIFRCSTFDNWHTVRQPHCHVLYKIAYWLNNLPRCYGLTYHYNHVIMGTMASQITSLTIVYSTVYSRRRSKKTSKLRVTGLCAGNSPVTGEFPAQRASNVENVSIWWRHHVQWILFDSCWVYDIRIRAWINNCQLGFLYDVIIHPYLLWLLRHVNLAHMWMNSGHNPLCYVDLTAHPSPKIDACLANLCP